MKVKVLLLFNVQALLNVGRCTMSDASPKGYLKVTYLIRGESRKVGHLAALNIHYTPEASPPATSSRWASNQELQKKALLSEKKPETKIAALELFTALASKFLTLPFRDLELCHV